MRTSFTIPEPLLYRLKITLAEQKKSMVAFVVEQVEKGLVASDEARKKRTYGALNGVGRQTTLLMSGSISSANRAAEANNKRKRSAPHNCC